MTDMAPGPRANPLAGNPLRTRSDLQAAVRDLVEPVVAHLSPSGARARLGSFGAVFPMKVAELEGYARPLWGIVPLVAGGGRFDHWDRWVSGLAAGTDPDHPDYWGPCVTGTPDQRMVEMAAIGYALASVPEHLWDPLTGTQRDAVVEWLRGIERNDPAPNNWQFFRLLVQHGLERLDIAPDEDARRRSTELIESYAREGGWYVDGFASNIDYYVPFAFHTYGLVLAASGLGDRAAAERYVERAVQFAPDFTRWFAEDGAAVPFGRSLTYRFAQGSFWGALAAADVEALPWGEVKGLALRHLRWWAARPISDRDGVLSVGYGYDNRRMAESYNSAGSPYWAMKAFLMLAAPESHPFWAIDEQPLDRSDAVTSLPHAGMVLTRDDDQAVAFVAQRSEGWAFLEQTQAKYKKFAYSSRWGFSGDLEGMFAERTTDSMLALTDQDSGERRTRNAVEHAHIGEGMAYARWWPFPDVRVDTVLVAGAPWHVRIHRIATPRTLAAAETGFALPLEPSGFMAAGAGLGGAGTASITSEHGRSTIVDLGQLQGRTGATRNLPVNANLMVPQTVVPALDSLLEPGEHLLVCAVGASSSAAAVDVGRHPEVPAEAWAYLDRMAAAPVDETDDGDTTSPTAPFEVRGARGDDQAPNAKEGAPVSDATIEPGLCSITFRDLDVDAIVDLASRAGVRGVEWGADVHVPPGGTAHAGALARRCGDAGLVVCSYGSYLGASPTDDATFRDEVERVLDTAEALRTDVVRAWTQLGVLPDGPRSDTDRVLERTAQLADDAARRDMIVALEFHPTTLTDTAESARRVLDRLDRSNLLTHWQPDPRLAPADAVAGFDLIAPDLAYLHVFFWGPRGIEDRRPLAEGAEVWEPVLTAAGSTPLAGDRTRYALCEYVADDDPQSFLDDARTLREWLEPAPGADRP